MNKTIIIINGKGGVGKDTLVDSLNDKLSVANISSVEWIKHVATLLGWHPEDKRIKDRKFLSDLRTLSENYNDVNFNYTVDKVSREFPFNDVVFVHIREPFNIEKYREVFESKGFTVKTLLIRRMFISNTDLGNMSDNDVENYPYDYYFNNIDDINESCEDFYNLIKSIIE